MEIRTCPFALPVPDGQSLQILLCLQFQRIAELSSARDRCEWLV